MPETRPTGSSLNIIETPWSPRALAFSVGLSVYTIYGLSIDLV